MQRAIYVNSKGISRIIDNCGDLIATLTADQVMLDLLDKNYPACTVKRLSRSFYVARYHWSQKMNFLNTRQKPNG